jgi:hypothetical protein
MNFGLGGTAWKGKQKLLIFASQEHGNDEGFDSWKTRMGHEASEDGDHDATIE